MSRVAKSEVLRKVSLGITGLIANLPEWSTAKVRDGLERLAAFDLKHPAVQKQSVPGEIMFAVSAATITLRAVGLPMEIPELAQTMLDEMAKEEERFGKFMHGMTTPLTSRAIEGDD